MNHCHAGNSIPAEIKAIIKRDFEEPAHILRLAEKFLACPRYSRTFFQLLLRIARGKAGESWSVRCFALALMEHQLSKLSPRKLSEFDKVLAGLGLKRPGQNWVAAEIIGCANRMTVAEFVPQFLQKLNRRSGRSHPGVALADLLHRSTQECKLVLAPCVFNPNEVFARILMQVEVSGGIRLSTFASAKKKSAGALRLAAYEREILRRLERSSQIYWVSGSTSSRINSLVEYPLGTAVLVLKLPGGSVEFEIKRAGKRSLPLGVLFAKDGNQAPVSHRLQGGGTGWMLELESNNESRFCSLFRAIYEKEPPLSRTLFITNVNRIPCQSGATDLLTWFTDADTFGAGYRQMRSALKRCLKAGGSPVPADPLGQTVAFLRDTQPRQSVLAGTSSFRLDRLSEYLSPLGSKHYFEDGLGVAWTSGDARQFADDLLEEVLGTYIQPDAPYRAHAQYLRAAFSIPENRAAANTNYLFCMEQIGLVWGTMLATGSYSIGESFVPRNVGLKSMWQDGLWKVKIIFMDHDCLQSPGLEQAEFHASAVMDGTIHDETHIFGHALSHRTNIGAVTCLQDIYRVTRPLARKGMRQLRGAMLRSFCKARTCAAGALLPSTYAARLLDFEEVVRMSMNPGMAAQWEAHAMTWLAAKGYTRKKSQEYQQALKKYARFFRQHAFLYQLPLAPRSNRLS